MAKTKQKLTKASQKEQPASTSGEGSGEVKRGRGRPSGKGKSIGLKRFKKNRDGKMIRTTTKDRESHRLKKASADLKYFIFKVLKQVHPECGISLKAMVIMHDMCMDIFFRIAREAGNLARISKRSTLSSRDIQTSVRLLFPGELAKHAVSEGTKAVTKYESSRFN